jgi:hypothetical protein
MFLKLQNLTMLSYISLAVLILGSESLYGFVIHDFNYQGMQAYRDLARSAVVLAVSVSRLGAPLSCDGLDGCVGPVSESACWQILCNQLIASVCNI